MFPLALAVDVICCRIGLVARSALENEVTPQACPFISMKCEADEAEHRLRAGAKRMPRLVLNMGYIRVKHLSTGRNPLIQKSKTA